MAARSNLAYFARITSARMFMEADKGGKTGNQSDAPEGTLKAQLDQAKTKIAELEPKAKAAEGLQAQIDTLTGQLEAANGAKKIAEDAKATAEGLLAKEQGKVSALEKDKEQLTEKVSTLEKDRERLSAARLNKGTTKDTPGNLDATAGDPVALWKTYAAADSVTKAAMREEHGAKLDAAALAFDREQQNAR